MSENTVEGGNHVTMTNPEATPTPSVAQLAKALVAAQGQFKKVERTCYNTYFQSAYADLAAIFDATREALVANGLALTQLVQPDSDQATLKTMLLHESGEYIECTIRLKPKATDPQAMGSALTYARRYAISGILGIASEPEDADTVGDMERKAPRRQQQPPRRDLPSQQPRPPEARPQGGTASAQKSAGTAPPDVTPQVAPEATGKSRPGAKPTQQAKPAETKAAAPGDIEAALTRDVFMAIALQNLGYKDEATVFEKMKVKGWDAWPANVSKIKAMDYLATMQGVKEWRQWLPKE